MGLLTPPVLSVHFFFCVNMTKGTEHQKEGVGSLEFWPCMPCIIWVIMIRRLYKHHVPAAGIDGGCSSWALAWEAGANPPLQASITNQIMASRPSTLAKLIKKLIRVNTPAFRLFDDYSSSTCELGQWTHLQTEILVTHKRMGCTFCKDDLMAYTVFCVH